MPLHTPSKTLLNALLLPAAVIAAASLTGCVQDPAPEIEQALSCDIPSSTIYVIDDVQMPLDGVAVEQAGFDLDGDGTPDNIAGSVFSAIVQALGGDTAAAWRDRMAERLDYPLAIVLQVERCPAGDQRVTLIGDELPIGALYDFVGGGDEAWYPLANSRIEIAPDGDGLVGRIGGSLPSGYHDTFATTLLPLVQAMQRSADETMANLGASFDADRDGTITLDELRASSLFEALFYADLDADGDDVEESLSIAVTFHAREL